MEDLLSDVGGKAETVIGAASVGVAWLSTKFKWWKDSDSKLVKIGVPLGLFICVMLILSALN
ncbi:MAG: hypothetical protein GY807_21150 [Gammaproteobacteria bacterium]|nr:hypothetical protein [Gammaproteobacteria bacterium]